ncbi:MAG: hypothetical protein COW84_09105 [Gammaproteobacteria bacterium CG22_combo_CG10-13_8_21_14_all_40_8]|nr:MAG: hypothetical protein COW84_09105 [Gammaproteobacteria bacterium CG22_combo_CG10-13_8_21_14_all_40_8]
MRYRHWLNVVIVAIAFMVILISVASKNMQRSSVIQDTPLSTVALNSLSQQLGIKHLQVNHFSLSFDHLQDFPHPAQLQNLIQNWQNLIWQPLPATSIPHSVEPKPLFPPQISIQWTAMNQLKSYQIYQLPTYWLLIDSDSIQPFKLNQQQLQQLVPQWLSYH